MYEKLKDIEVFVLDMDGTIYLGNKVIDGAVEFVERAKALGKRILYFTNNASRNKEIYVERLNGMGFMAERSDILTSGDVTVNYFKKNKDISKTKFFVLGTPALQKSFTDNGLLLTDGLDADAVVSSFDTTLCYDRLNTACRLISSGAEFYSTHEDINCPTEYGFMPDSGAINACITASTGKKPKYFGKPNLETAQMISDYTDTGFDKIAIVGDRLYTDIALGRLHGLTSILVLTGETKLSDVNEDNSPTFYFDSINCIPIY